MGVVEAGGCFGGCELTAMPDPSGLLQLWELEEGLMEAETLSLPDCSVEVAEQVG